MSGTLVALADTDSPEPAAADRPSMPMPDGARDRRNRPWDKAFVCHPGAMGAVRVVVDDVDAAISAWSGAGYAVGERWGPPFAILRADGEPDIWLAGTGTSAARTLEPLDAGDAASASVRQVLEIDDVVATVATLVSAGWEAVGEPLSGPGGAQQLVRRGPVFLEVFAGA
jgi:hypothetical protein